MTQSLVALAGAFSPLAVLVSVLCFSVDEPVPRAEVLSGDEAHHALFSEIPFPSAQECAVCHPGHFREWSVSSHAYAQLSPTFNAYQSLLGKLSNGTLGDFCVRCHTQVGSTRGESPFQPTAQRSAVAMEGITCVVCHRVPAAYGKNTGRLPLLEGDIFQEVVGPRSAEELQRVLTTPEEFPGFEPVDGRPGRRIHSGAQHLEQMSQPAFCGRCHDVRHVDGFRLEDAFSEFKQTPSAARGESCQDCHMGPEPGIPSEYPLSPAAIVGGKPTRPARRTNHMWVAADEPLIHPGIFPINPEAQAMASPDEWAVFDYEAGWGTDDFEDTEPDEAGFPETWSDVDDRYYAREILDGQLELLEEARERGTALLKRGYGLGEPYRLDSDGALSFSIDVLNLTDGHSVPTGLIAERNVFLQVVVSDPAGEVVFRSGDLDPNGDVRDQHSKYVHAGALPLDRDLFNLRSPFLVRSAFGGEREQILPANYSVDPLIFFRPSSDPTLLQGGTPQIRLHKRNIEALGKRTARYRVPRRALGRIGTYTVEVQLVAGQLPPHLIDAIAPAGFDYGLTARDLADAIVERYRVLRRVEFRMEWGG